MRWGGWMEQEGAGKVIEKHVETIRQAHRSFFLRNFIALQIRWIEKNENPDFHKSQITGGMVGRASGKPFGAERRG